MELKFEFVQDDEFSNHYYIVRYNNVFGGYIAYHKESLWMFSTEHCYVTPFILDAVSDKINELNASLKQQRILGVF